MNEQRTDLQKLLANRARAAGQKLRLFAWLNLGVIESLGRGSMSADDAVAIFFHADNCLFVRKYLKNRIADDIKSRGVQLPDLFEALPASEAHREFQHELDALRSLCLKLLDSKKMAA